MNFNKNTWKEKVSARLNQFKDYIKKDAGPPVYATVASMTLVPLFNAALSGGYFPALNALFNLLSNVGTNLIASELEKWKDSKKTVNETEIIQWINENVSHHSELRNEIDEILLKMDAIPLVQNSLNPDDKKWFASELKKQLHEMGNFERFEQTIIQGDIVNFKQEAGIIVQRDMYQQNVIIASEKNALKQLADSIHGNNKPDIDITKAVEKYLSLIRDEYWFLAFKGMGVSDRIPLRLPLIEMYVPLKVRIELPEGETLRRDLKLAGRQIISEEAENIGQRDPQPVLKLLKNHDCLIILGDPGAGKTTFLKYLSLKLAMGHGEDMQIGNRLPVLVPLSAYANAIAENKSISLNQFIVKYFSEREVDLPLNEMLKQAMENGSVLYLLDGLDEVQSIGDRIKVVDRMLAFFRFHQDKKNKIIMTSRIVGYRDVRPVSKGLSECTLVDFETDDIKEFVQKWTKAVEKSANLNEDLAEQAAIQEEKELLQSVDHNKGVRQLASNPLLLTILALMKRQGVRLPERRVELYHNYIYTLLKNWNLVRSLDGPIGVDLDVLETIRVLAPLALWMHETSPGVGLVKQEGLRLKLEEIYTKRGTQEPEQAAQNLLNDVHKHTALLLERGPGMYGFIHLTFQEYLAAIAVAQSGQKHSSTVIYTLLDHVTDNTWVELTRLCIAYIGIIEGREEAASDILLDLIKKSNNKAINLAAKVVKDAWPGGLTIKCKEKVTELLIRTLGEAVKLA
ncbi:histidine kinase [Candidatus Magnetomorum sp. HK-1]|nr:histidine kinase [Candidatus Magnetomorum sp. HK-1]